MQVDSDERSQINVWDIYTHPPQSEIHTVRAMIVNTAGVFFEQSGPFDSHLNTIQI